MIYKILLALSLLCTSASQASVTKVVHANEIRNNDSNALTFKVPAAANSSSRALILNGAGELSSSAVTDTELGYVSGVTSAIQTQFSGKEPTITATTAADYFSGAKTFLNFDTSVRGAVLTGYVSGAGTLAATDTVLQAFNKLNGNVLLKRDLNDSSAFYVGPLGTGRPYTTISAALTAMGAAVSEADFEKARIVYISGGQYDESITIPRGRTVTLVAEGTVVLGDGALANYGSTIARSITFQPDSADIFGSDIKPALNLVGMAANDPTSTFLAEAGGFIISGNINIDGAGVSHTVNLSNTKVQGSLTKTTLGLTNLQGYKLLVVGASNLTSAQTILERCYDCEFDGLLSLDSYNAIINSELKAGMTVTANANTLPPSGIFFSTLFGTFTGPVGMLKLDLASDYFFRANGATLGGAATKVILSPVATAAITGVLSSTDWSTFNNKEPAITATTSADYYRGDKTFQPFNAAAIGSVLTGYTSGAGVISAADSILSAIQKLNGNVAASVTGVSSVFGRSGAVVSANGDYTASQVTNVPAGNIAATDVQAALNELDSEKQASGSYVTSLTGDATGSGPGATAVTLATVNGNVGSFGTASQTGTFTVNAKGLVTAASNTSIQIAESQVTSLTADLALKAPLASPALTGVPTTPTGAPLTGGTQIASQAYADAAAAAAPGLVTSVFGRTGAVVSANGDYTASQVTNVAHGQVASVTVQSAINELEDEKQQIPTIQTPTTGGVIASGAMNLWIFGDPSGGSFSLTLPLAANSAGRMITVKNISATNDVNMIRNVPDFVEGGSSVTVGPHESKVFFCPGSGLGDNWYVID